MYHHNVVTSSAGILFVHTKAKNLEYEEVDERAMMLYLLMRFVLGFHDIEVIIDPTKEQMIEALERLKEAITDHASGSSKDKKKAILAAVVNVGFHLNLDY